MMLKFAAAGLAGVLCMLPAAAAAAPAVDDTAGRAVIRAPLVLEKLADLDFGTFASSPLSGAVIIDPSSGAQTTLGGVTALPTAVSHRARFRARGPALGGAVVVLGLPPVLANGSGDAMPVAALTMDGGPIRTFDAGGALDIGVGGLLQVGSGQADGLYTGSFTLTIVYL